MLPLLYVEETVEGVRLELERACLAGNERWHKEILDRYAKRSGSLARLLLLYDEGRTVTGDAQRGQPGRLGIAAEAVDAVVNSRRKMRFSTGF